jgi:hypothetical protein
MFGFRRFSCGIAVEKADIRILIRFFDDMFGVWSRFGTIL